MLDENRLFTSYAMRYPSDGLTIYGFITVPKGKGPFPVIVSVHGYAPYGSYDIYNTTYDFADYFSENGFIVLHPGMRNYPPSDNGDNILRVGMTVDVMNLIALIKSHTELPPELANANTDSLGLWGTSMGGEVALRVITISSDIKATVLYSALGGNEERNSRQLYEVMQDEKFRRDAQVPIELMDRISPMYYYHMVTSAVQINHGTEDTTAPISWAVETCEFLTSAGVSTQCIYYEGAKHAFNAENNQKIRLNALQFFQLHLAP
jgi:dipeptidyl aminopeptidase/acylaminoacyl peptidase